MLVIWMQVPQKSIMGENGQEVCDYASNIILFHLQVLSRESAFLSAQLSQHAIEQRSANRTLRPQLNQSRHLLNR